METFAILDDGTHKTMTLLTGRQLLSAVEQRSLTVRTVWPQNNYLGGSKVAFRFSLKDNLKKFLRSWELLLGPDLVEQIYHDRRSMDNMFVDNSL